MTNLDISVKDNKVTIVASLVAAGRRSKSGMSTVIASTQGNITIPGTDVKLGLNMWRYADPVASNG